MYLNKIESELGIRLFDRSKSPILPTNAGRLYIDELKKIQQIEKNLTFKLGQMAHPEEILNIGIGPMRSATWMPQLLARFREIYPDVSVNLLEQGDESLPAKLRSDDVDVIIGTMSLGLQATVVELALEQVLLIAPRSFQLAPQWVYPGNACENPYEIQPVQLQGLPLILPSPMNDLSTFSNQILDHFSIRPRSVITATSMYTAATLVAHGMGYLFTSPVFLETQLEQLTPHILYCTMSKIPNTRKLVAAYKAGSRKEQMILQFLSLLKSDVLPKHMGLSML